MDRDVSRRENYSKIPDLRSDTSLDTAQKLLFSLSLSLVIDSLDPTTFSFPLVKFPSSWYERNH